MKLASDLKNRRAVINASTIAGAAVAAAEPSFTSASGHTDPIITMVAELNRLRALIDASGRRADAVQANGDSAGYLAACESIGALCGQYNELLSMICRTPAVTIRGAFARLSAAARMIRDEHTSGGAFDADELEDYEEAVLGVVADLERLRLLDS